MKHLFRHWARVEKEICEKPVVLFLDYDGTLTPIVETPSRAVLSQPNKDVLAEFLQISSSLLVIISGRSLLDIKMRIGLKGIIYIGNHGLEIEGPGIQWRCLMPSDLRKTFQEIKNKIRKRLSLIKGFWMEDKILTLSLHYRLAVKTKALLVKKIFYEICEPYCRKNKIKINYGRKVLEVRPPVSWDKGKAVLWLLAKQHSIFRNDNTLPIYLGDDMTDEDAFKSLKDQGLTIRVGRLKRSGALYYLKDTKEVTQFLKRLLRLKKGVF